MLSSQKTRMSPVIIEQDSLWWVWPMSTTCHRKSQITSQGLAMGSHHIPPMLVIKGSLAGHQALERHRQDCEERCATQPPAGFVLIFLNYPMPSITHLQVPSKGFQTRCRPVKGWKNMEHLGTPECVLRCGMKDREVTQRMTNSVPTSGMLSSVRTFPRRCLRLEWNWHHLTLAYVLRLSVSLLLCMIYFVCVVIPVFLRDCGQKCSCVSFHDCLSTCRGPCFHTGKIGKPSFQKGKPVLSAREKLQQCHRVLLCSWRGCRCELDSGCKHAWSCMHIRYIYIYIHTYIKNVIPNAK